MGYETRLHIGTAIDMEPGKKSVFLEIATIDLCKVAYGKMGELIGNIKEACKTNGIEMVAVKNEVGDCSHTISPGIDRGFKFTELSIPGQEDMTDEDLYGDKLVLVPAEAVLYAMRYDNSKEPYRRFPPAIALLESIVDNFEKEEIYCILYGH